MLRSVRLRSDISRPFVCRRCLSSLRSGSSESLRPSANAKARLQNGTAVFLTSKRSSSAYTAQRSNTAPNLSTGSASQRKHPFLDIQQIRLRTVERLRQWEDENASSFISPPELKDNRPSGELRNSWTRRGNEEFVIDPDMDGTNEDLNTKVFGRDDLLDVGNDRVFLRQGDLVELLSMEGLDRELAIYIGDFDTQSQFYTMSGSWVHRQSKSVPFSIPHFVEPHELDKLRPYLPAADVPAAMQDKLHSMSQHVPRSAGQSLIRKMMDFWAQANAAYQAHSVKLDTAHAHVARPAVFRYATLDEIAGELLPEVVENTEGDKLPYPVLYAVHRSLMVDGVGFNTPMRRPLRAGGYYEIMSANDMANIKLVQSIVREHVDTKLARKSDARPRSMPHRQGRLDRFVAKAQQRIDISRKTRHFTPYGTIGPVSKELGDLDHPKLRPLKDDFDQLDMKIAQVLELWAALRSFKDFSPLNGTGAAILRAVNRYDEETDLHRVTAWTFLQEIGAMAPWESRSSFDMRLPNTGLRLAGLPGCGSIGFVPDKLKDIRKDWGDLPVYCVDSIDAGEIDDGISIEPTDTAGQYWMHIHTADPGSHIDPTSIVAQHAGEVVETIYMPDRVVPMLQSSFVRANLSLAPHRPCLTYSAKMNTDGELLDYNVTAGTIHNVRHITPRVVEESVLESPFSKKHNTFLIGSGRPVSKPRRMVQGHELSDREKENIRCLHDIGKAHTQRRVARGAIYNATNDFSASASINGSLPVKNAASATYHDDPSIQILTEVVNNSAEVPAEDRFFDIVQPAMLIAGEVVARWCRDRDIPIIHRLTTRNDEKTDPAEFFFKNVLPTRNERGDFDLAQERAFLNLLGTVQPSTTPGPHISMGLEMFARCTSPLRRYVDLLLQWQVESALLEEARLGHSLVGTTNHKFLPFTKAQIDSRLPYIDARERLINYGKRRARDHWLNHFLLRAWKFGEGDIPRTFSYVVTSIEHSFKGSRLNGQVDHFQINAICPCSEQWPPSKFEVGNILEVELDNINIYQFALEFKPIRHIDASQKEALDKENLSTMQSQEII